LLLFRLSLFYNFNKFIQASCLFQRYIIKTENVFSVIREINEILSLTNEPDKLVNTALDTLSQILEIEGCWIQTIDDRKNQKLCLAADRGFTDEMRLEITSMGLKHDFAGQIIGMGNKITIPDLNNESAYGLSSFRKAGYKWVVAVPLMTYRAWGLLGTASKNKRVLDKDTAELIMVIGGLIANAWGKAHLSNSLPRRGSLPDKAAIKPDIVAAYAETITDTTPITQSAKATPEDVPETEPIKSPAPPPFTAPQHKTAAVSIEKEAPPVKSPPKPLDPAFHSHKRKMESFRKAHKQAK
jgi:transcriptional regulator with GAF, ATPase, and Fis domain